SDIRTLRRGSNAFVYLQPLAEPRPEGVACQRDLLRMVKHPPHPGPQARSVPWMYNLSIPERCWRMTPQEMLQAGEEAIGGNSASDYKIEPSKHAELLMGRAPALATVLRRSEILALAEQYEQKDQRAIKNQAAFKATANRANRAILITACFSALLVVT